MILPGGRPWPAGARRLYRTATSISPPARAVNSDGMKARLMFSIATSIEPDVLLLDELLGAGDVSFRAKAMARMNELLDRSKAMIVVTHNLTFVRERARKALYLEKGAVVYYGFPHKAVDLYLERTGREGRSVPADAYLLEEV